MKIKLMLFSFLFLASGCDNPIDSNDSNLQISFKNNSEYTLSKFIVGDKLIGELSSNSSTKYFAFDNFGFDTGMPNEDASAEVNGKLLTNYNRGYWCGTEKTQVDSGKYLIEVHVLDSIINLSCDNATTIYHP